MAQVAKTQSGNVLVDINAKVTPELLASIKSAGGNVIYASTRFNGIRAELPLTSLERIASSSDVLRIKKAAIATTSVGTVTSQAYVSHRAKQVVEQQGISGAGVIVGVLSDSALPAQVAALKASGNLPPKRLGAARAGRSLERHE